MIKALGEKISKFAALHPRAMTYGITICATVGIALVLISVMNPHEASADYVIKGPK